MSIEVTVEYAHREWNSYDHVVHIRNYQQLQAKVAELEAEVERLSAAHVKACQANADSQAELAKAEQRVAEACKSMCLSLDRKEKNHAAGYGIGYLNYSAQDIANLIDNGEWRKFVKEV